MFGSIGAFVLFGFGLIVGSFLNVVILRFGFLESPQKRSHCMSCGTLIRAYDLVPVISFMFLRGRCRACGSRLSLQYPLVELSTAILFALAVILVPPSASVWSAAAFLSLLAFLAILVALVVYDIRHTLVPMPFLYTLLASAFSAPLFQSIGVSSWAPLFDALLGGSVLSGFFFGIYLLTRGKGMGLGDAYVAGAGGLLLGLVRGIEAVMFGVWGGTLYYLLVMLLSSVFARISLLGRIPRVTMKTEVPFVPFLALGILTALFTDLSPLSFVTWLLNTIQ